MQASKLQPAVLGGVLIGVLSALPIVSAGNLCCCLWVLLGGAVAAYLLQQNQSTPLSVGDGAIVGMLAGLVGAVVGTVLTIPVLLMFGPLQAEYMARILDNPEIPPEAKQAIGNFMPSGGVSVMWLMFTLFFSLVVGRDLRDAWRHAWRVVLQEESAASATADAPGGLPAAAHLGGRARALLQPRAPNR